MARLPLLTCVAAACLLCSVFLAGRAGDDVIFGAGHTARYSGTILDAAPSSGIITVDFLADDGHRLLVFLTGTVPPVGTHVVLRGALQAFDGPRNPGEPDQHLIQHERGFGAQIERAQIVSVLGRSQINLPIGLALARDWAAKTLRRDLAEPYASILAGELWGERSNLPPNLRAEFQETGTVHILVTAGLHLGIVAMLLLALVRRLPLPRALACAITCAGVWAYVLFAGSHLPAMRAATMISFALAARAAGRKGLSWNALSTAVIMVLLADPSSVHSASFCMSFSCVAAILLFAPPIQRFLERIENVPALAIEAVTLSAATQIGVWPITASTFLMFAPYAVLANALVVPLVGLTMFAGALQLATSGVPPVAQACANVNAWLFSWMTAVVGTISGFPFAHIVVTPPPSWTIAVYDASLLAALWLWKRGALGAAVASAFFGCTIVLWPPLPLPHDLRITMLDVGQADSIVIQTPGGHAILVDGGGRLERGATQSADSVAEQVGERVVVPFLIRAGVHHLDAILLSHPHGDHAGGVAPVLRALGADEFADSGQTYGGFAYRDAVFVARQQKTASQQNPRDQRHNFHGGAVLCRSSRLLL